MNVKPSRGILFCFVCGDDVTQHRDAGCAGCACVCAPLDIVSQWWASNSGGASPVLCPAPGLWDLERELREIETSRERSQCAAVVVRGDGTPVARRSPGGALVKSSAPLQPEVARTVRAVLPSVFSVERPFVAVLPPATLTKISALRFPGMRYAALLMEERREPDVVARAGQRFALSRREREILGLLLAGLPTRVIGEELGIAVGTVRVHTKRLVKKARAESVHDFLAGLTSSLST